MGTYQVGGSDLRMMIKVARNQPVAFAFNPGNTDTDHYLAMDRKRPVEVLRKSAKKEGPGPKVAFGTAKVDGRLMSLTCDKLLPGLAKKVRRYLKLESVSLSVQILDPDGNILESELEDETEPDEGQRPTEPPQSADDPNLAKWQALSARLDPVVLQFADGRGEAGHKVRSVWELAKNKAEAEDYPSAFQAAKSLLGLMKANEAAAVVPPSSPVKEASPDKTKWEKVAAKIAPMVAELRADTRPDAVKICAVWEKLETMAQAGRYAEALGPIPKIAKLIESLRTPPASAEIDELEQARQRYSDMVADARETLPKKPELQSSLLPLLKQAQAALSAKQAVDALEALDKAASVLAGMDQEGESPKQIAVSLRDIWDEAAQRTDRQLDALLRRIGADGSEQAQRVTGLGLSAWSKGAKTKLMVAILNLERTPPDGLTDGIRKETAKAIRAYADFLEFHPAVEAIENNPWNETVELSSVLAGALKKMEKTVLQA